jgi:adenine-specific DNA-methyltransferase
MNIKKGSIDVLNTTIDLLKKDSRFISKDGILLKNQIQELVYKNDSHLVKELLSNKTTKQCFFFEIDKALIFDKEKFINFISNKQFLPDSYTSFKNKIGLINGKEYLSENKETVLV